MISAAGCRTARDRDDGYGRRGKRGGLFFEPGSGKLFWPANGKVTSRFGHRNGRPHRGIDIAAPRGTTIRAADNGIVVYAGWQNGFGRVVKVRHKHGYTLYAHCDSMDVDAGDYVERGEPIAEVGTSGNATGPHLHFEYHRQGRAVNPSV